MHKYLKIFSFIVSIMLLLNNRSFSQDSVFNKKFVVINFKRSITTDSNGTSFKQREACLNWNIKNKDELGFILNRMKLSNGYEIHDNYNYYPCSIDGVLIYNKKKYIFSLNAGGYLYLFENNVIKFSFVAKENDIKIKKYFLSTFIEMDTN